MLVSAIMPTRSRPQYAQEALGCFLSQTYQDRELVIVDDADDPSFPEGVSLPGVVYHRLNKRLTIGAKRNLACSRASEGVIVHWDDDDVSAPERIEDQLARLVDSNSPLVGYHSMRFLDVQTGEWWKYSGAKHYALGTSLMYTKEFWRANPFMDISLGEDNAVVNRASRIVSVDAGEMMYARNHASNTDRREAMLTAEEWVKL